MPFLTILPLRTNVQLNQGDLMRSALITIFFAISSFAIAAGNRIDCHDIVKGEGVTVETKVTFDSKGPSLKHVMKLEFKGNPPHRHRHRFAFAGQGLWPGTRLRQEL